MTYNLIPADLLTPSEVAEIFGVNAKTVTRWAKDGKLPSRRTLGGHRRFDVQDVINAMEAKRDAS